MITFTDGQKVYSISDYQHLAIIYVTYIETNDTIVFCYCCTYVLRRCVCVFWTVVSFELKGTMGKLQDQMFLLFDVYKCKCVFGVFFLPDIYRQYNFFISEYYEAFFRQISSTLYFGIFFPVLTRLFVSSFFFRNCMPFKLCILIYVSLYYSLQCQKLEHHKE